MRVADFDYDLPPELIAQFPAAQRDASRLLVMRRSARTLEHTKFREVTRYLQVGDVLVLNNSKVIPARLRGSNGRTGGRFEMLLVKEIAANEWWAMLRPGKRARIGTRITILSREALDSGLAATVLATNEEGHRLLRFEGTPNLLEAINDLGEVPLPPYIARPVGNASEADLERYQTVFAKFAGSVAAPTAGLHFTETLLEEIRSRGVLVCNLTLHVGLGTFAPVKCEALENHTMHEERYQVSEETARAVNAAKHEARRVIAVGTTTVRVLESLAKLHDGKIKAGGGSTKIFIYPPYQFRIVDALLTNFHLPRSTLLMLVSAFAAPGETRGRQVVQEAYAEAIRLRYRFFSYGDAMLICD